MAFTIERVAYKPLRNAPRISALITAIGVSFFLEYFVRRLSFHPNFITYKRPFEVANWVISTAGIYQLQPGQAPPDNSVIFSNISIVIVIVSLLLLLVLNYFVRRTDRQSHARRLLTTSRLRA